MITVPTRFMLLFFLIAGFTVKCNSPQIDGKSNGNNSLKPATSGLEIFKVTRDTIYVSVEGSLSRALLIHDKYYAFYEVRDPTSTGSIKKFYTIGKKGKIERETKMPKEINDEYYYKLYYWMGRIVVNAEFNKSTYHLNEDKNKFIKEPEFIQIPLFEDENYRVTADCRGEFGSTIYLKNKSTNTTYSTNSECPFLVNKLGDRFIVNTSGVPSDNIVVIKVPLRVKTLTKSNSLEVVPSAAAKTVFSTDNLGGRFYIPTSFVAKGSLYNLFNSHQNELAFDGKEHVIITKDSVKIGIIDNSKFKPVYLFKDKFDIKLEQQLSPNYQICTFHTEERIQVGFKKDIPPYMEAKYGLIEIMGNEIKIHYFFSKKG